MHVQYNLALRYILVAHIASSQKHQSPQASPLHLPYPSPANVLHCAHYNWRQNKLAHKNVVEKYLY